MILFKPTLILSLLFICGLTACNSSAPTGSALHIGNLDESLRFQSVASQTPRQSLGEQRELLNQVGKLLTQTMLECPSQIWPSYDWRQINVIMTVQDQVAFIWRGQAGGQMTELPLSSVPPQATRGTYSFFEYEGSKTVSFLLEKDERHFTTVQAIFRLIVHEGFHYHGQAGWKRKEGARRTTLVPLDPAPRFYRHMMFRRMKEHFISSQSDTSSLRKAAFWFQKWKTESPHELPASTDGYEGTAQYADLMASLLSEVGCQMSEEKLRQKAVARASDPAFYEFVESTQTSLDSEGYSMGNLAALILRFNQKNRDWQERVQKAETPVEILFENVAPETDHPDIDLEKSYLAATQASNIKIMSMIDADLQLLKKQDSILIAPSYESNSGSKGYQGFFTPRSMPEVIFGPWTSPVTFQTKAWSLTAEAGKSDLTISIPSPCWRAAHVVVMDAADLQLTEGWLEASGSGLQGRMPGELKTDSNGRRWFCGQSAD